MFGVVLYLISFVMLEFLFVGDGNYRKLSIGLLLLLIAAVWLTRKKWKRWLKERYSRMGILVSEKDFGDLFGNVLWLGLELFYMIFLLLVPGFLFDPFPTRNADILIVLVGIVLFVMTLCDTQFDTVLTGERALPARWIRVMPVSLVAAVAAAVLYVRPGKGGEPSKLALYLQILFLAELALNLGIRFFLQKKRETAGALPGSEPVRKLKMTAWVLISVALVEVFPLLPLLSQEAPRQKLLIILGIDIAVQTLCMLFFFLKKPIWSAWAEKRMERVTAKETENRPDGQDISDSIITVFLLSCWIVFGNIIPNLLLPGCEEFDLVFFCTALPTLFLLLFGLSYPVYPVLTGDRELPSGKWRIPYLTLAVTLYAVMTVSLPWTDVRLPAGIAALAIVELAVILGTRRVYLRMKSPHRKII